jgi:flagellar biosynthetic protein FliO
MESMEQMMAVAVVLALLGGALWFLRKRGVASFQFAGRRGERSLEPLDRLGLGPQHVLHLVRYRDRALLLAVSPSGCVLLDQSPVDRLAGAHGVGR